MDDHQQMRDGGGISEGTKKDRETLPIVRRLDSVNQVRFHIGNKLIEKFDIYLYRILVIKYNESTIRHFFICNILRNNMCNLLLRVLMTLVKPVIA